MYYLLRVKHSKTWLIGLSQLICLSVNLFVIWSDMIDSGPTTLANNNSCYQIFIRTWKHLDRYMWHHIFPCEQRPHFQSVRRAQTKKTQHTHIQIPLNWNKKNCVGKLCLHVGLLNYRIYRLRKQIFWQICCFKIYEKTLPVTAKSLLPLYSSWEGVSVLF